MIRTDCPRCLTEYRFREGLANSFVRCPRCKEKFRVAENSHFDKPSAKASGPSQGPSTSPIEDSTSGNQGAISQKRRAACPHCHCQYKFKPENAGRQYECKKCGRFFEMREYAPSYEATQKNTDLSARPNPVRPQASQPPPTSRPKSFGKLPFMQMDDGPDVIELGDDDIVERNSSFEEDALDLDTSPAQSAKQPARPARTGPRRLKSGGMPTSYLGRPARHRKGSPPATAFHYYMWALLFGFLAIFTMFLFYQVDISGMMKRQSEQRRQERERQQQRQRIFPFQNLPG